MNILKGSLPTESIWRVAVMLEPRAGVSLDWQLGLTLARANGGALLAVVLVREKSAETVAHAEETLASVKAICTSEDRYEGLIVEMVKPERTVREIVAEARIDMIVTDLNMPEWASLQNLPCTVAALRYGGERAESIRQTGFRRVLIPTSGGPHTVAALQYLAPLPDDVEIDALYVARSDQGAHEEALGHSRLESMLQLADVTDRVQRRVIRAESPIAGIVSMASKGYDLVVIGATQESSLDRALFGDIVSAVVRESKVPVLVVRRPKNTTKDMLSRIDFAIRKVIPSLPRENRRDVYVKLRENATPDFDYTVLITLSAAIAALGLILNSPAVVIGAMLVAPLMSPIVATGMALILGDARFLRFALGSAVRGAIIAIVVGILVGLLPGDNMTAEVLARTQPSLIDLGVALFSGLAGAFALTYWEASGALPGVAIAAALVPPLASVGISFADGDWRRGLGALLLFATNYITIALAAAFVFGVFGFRPNRTAKSSRRVRFNSGRIALLAFLIVGLILTPTTISLYREQTRREIIEKELTDYFGADESGLTTVSAINSNYPTSGSEPYIVTVTIVSERPFSEFNLTPLQSTIEQELRGRGRLNTAFQLRVIHDNLYTVAPSESHEE